MVSRLSTPPPPVGIKTPPTPRHGTGDNWEPYVTRKSTRVSSRRSQGTTTTPSPRSTYNLRGSSTSPGNAMNDVPSSNPQSPIIGVTKKRGAKSLLGGHTRRASGALIEGTTAQAVASLGLPTTSSESKMASLPPTSLLRKNGMLPTPTKTPKKSPNKVTPGISSIARNLFPVRYDNPDDAMPTSRRGRKKFSGYTLDSFQAADEDSPIQIYTDSHDRVPEVDLSNDNPFYGKQSVAVPEPTKRPADLRRVEIPGEGEIPLDEAMQRQDGAVYVFRGKRKFRKYTEMDDDKDSSGEAVTDTLDAELDATVSPHLRGPQTRSSVKPRLLFPSPEQLAARAKKPQVTDDEEAMTERELSNEASTPPGEVLEEAITPVALKFTPATPPSTVHRTRSMGFDGAFDEDSAHLASTPTHGKKRQGGRISRADGEVKRRQRTTRSRIA